MDDVLIPLSTDEDVIAALAELHNYGVYMLFIKKVFNVMSHDLDLH